MFMRYDPDEFESVVDHKVCSYHRQHPGISSPHCLCSVSYSLVRRPAADVARDKALRRRAEEDAILRQAAAIKVLRALEKKPVKKRRK